MCNNIINGIIPLSRQELMLNEMLQLLRDIKDKLDCTSYIRFPIEINENISEPLWQVIPELLPRCTRPGHVEFNSQGDSSW